MSCQCSSACPDAVPTVNRTEVTNSAYPDVEVEIAEIVEDQEWEVTARVSEDIDIPWLIRFHFVDAIPGSTGELGQESLAPPETPGVSQFFKVTDKDGELSFRVANATDGTWYLCAAVVGRVATSDPIVFNP